VAGWDAADPTFAKDTAVWFDLDPILASPWIYLAVMALIMVDVYLPITPSGTTLIAASVYAYSGETSLVVLLLCAATASTLGDAVAFRVARRGSGAIGRLVARHRLAERADDRLRSTLRRNLGRTIVFARFVPAGRMIVTFTSGTDAQVSHARFQPWSALAAVCWASYTVGLGCLNAMLFDTTWVAAVTAVVSVTVIGAVLARARPAASLSA